MDDLCQEKILNFTLSAEYENISLGHFPYPNDLNVWKKPDYVGYLKLFSYAAVIIGGLFGNVSVISTVAMNRSMRNTINIYIANMALADAMICIVCMVPHALSVLTGNVFVLGEFMCKFNPYTMMTCLTCSVFTLCAISCDRFMAIMFPLQMRVTKQRTSVVMSIVWIISLIVATPLLVVKKHFFVEWKDFQEPKCLEEWPVVYYYDESIGECLLSEPLRYIYYLVVSITLFFLPILIMITAYSLIIWRLWKSEIPGEQHEANVNAHSKSRKKVIKMVFTVLIAFAICWTPIQVHFLTQSFHISFQVFMSEYEWFAHYIAYANSFINPIIYGRFNKNFRDGFCMALRCGCKQDRTGRLARWRSTLSTRLTELASRRSSKTVTELNKVTRS